jgi:hypothetical protein
MRLISAALVVLLGCGGSQTSTSATEDETQRDSRRSSAAEEGPSEDVFVGRIVDRGPIGSGECVQQSYEIETDDGERLWVHFEACGAFDGPRFDALESGRRYRFTVERGGSPNFADGPMIVDAELLSEPEAPAAAQCASDDQCEMYAFCCACPRTAEPMHVDEAAELRERCTRVRCAACSVEPPPDTRVARCVDGACVAVQP